MTDSPKPKGRPKKIKPEVAPEPIQEVPKAYNGPVVILFENPSQVEYLKTILNMPQTLQGSEILTKARIIECVYQSVSLLEFNDKIIQKYEMHLKEQERLRLEKEEYLRKAAEYEANKDPNAIPKAANTPQTILLKK